MRRNTKTKRIAAFLMSLLMILTMVPFASATPAHTVVDENGPMVGQTEPATEASVPESQGLMRFSEALMEPTAEASVLGGTLTANSNGISVISDGQIHIEIDEHMQMTVFRIDDGTPVAMTQPIAPMGAEGATAVGAAENRPWGNALPWSTASSYVTGTGGTQSGNPNHFHHHAAKLLSPASAYVTGWRGSGDRMTFGHSGNTYNATGAVLTGDVLMSDEWTVVDAYVTANVDGHFGQGNRLTIIGTVARNEEFHYNEDIPAPDTTFQRRLVIETSDAVAGVVAVSAYYTFTGRNQDYIRVSRFVENNFRIVDVEPINTNSNDNEAGIWMYSGGATHWGRDWITPVFDNMGINGQNRATIVGFNQVAGTWDSPIVNPYERNNWFWRNDGCVPFNAFWGTNVGIGMGSAMPHHVHGMEIPIRGSGIAGNHNEAYTWIAFPGMRLEMGTEEFVGASIITVADSDHFAANRQFSRAMQQVDVGCFDWDIPDLLTLPRSEDMPSWAWDPIVENWGYGTGAFPENQMDKVHEYVALGARSLSLDAHWYDAGQWHGDGASNQRFFPIGHELNHATFATAGSWGASGNARGAGSYLPWPMRWQAVADRLRAHDWGDSESLTAQMMREDADWIPESLMVPGALGPEATIPGGTARVATVGNQAALDQSFEYAKRAVRGFNDFMNDHGIEVIAWTKGSTARAPVAGNWGQTTSRGLLDMPENYWHLFRVEGDNDWLNDPASRTDPGRQATAAEIMNFYAIGPDGMPQLTDGTPYLCMANPDVVFGFTQAKMRYLVEDLNFAGLKIDSNYGAAQCFGTDCCGGGLLGGDPSAALRGYAHFHRMLYDWGNYLRGATETLSGPITDPERTIMIMNCNCGQPHNFFGWSGTNRPVPGDLQGARMQRYNSRVFRAFYDSTFPVAADHVYLTLLGINGADDTRPGLPDFLSHIGVGLVVDTKYKTHRFNMVASFNYDIPMGQSMHYPGTAQYTSRPAPGTPAWNTANPTSRNAFKWGEFIRWFGLYNDLQISRAYSLDEYRHGIDYPEGYAFRVDNGTAADSFFHSFYATTNSMAMASKPTGTGAGANAWPLRGASGPAVAGSLGNGFRRGIQMDPWNGSFTRHRVWDAIAEEYVGPVDESDVSSDGIGGARGPRDRLWDLRSGNTFNGSIELRGLTPDTQFHITAVASGLVENVGGQQWTLTSNADGVITLPDIDFEDGIIFKSSPVQTTSIHGTVSYSSPREIRVNDFATAAGAGQAVAGQPGVDLWYYETWEVIPGAELELRNLDGTPVPGVSRTATDMYGRFVFPIVPDGDFIIVATAFVDEHGVPYATNTWYIDEDGDVQERPVEVTWPLVLPTTVEVSATGGSQEVNIIMDEPCSDCQCSGTNVPDPGNYSLRLQGNGTSPNALVQWTSLVQGGDFEFSVWVKGQGNLTIGFTAGAPGIINRTGDNAIDYDEWTKLTGRVSAPPDDSPWGSTMTISGSNTGDQVLWIDNMTATLAGVEWTVGEDVPPDVNYDAWNWDFEIPHFGEANPGGNSWSAGAGNPGGEGSGWSIVPPPPFTPPGCECGDVVCPPDTCCDCEPAAEYAVTRAATSTVPADNMAITPAGPQAVGTPMTVTVTPPTGQRIVASSLAVTGVAGIELTATGATFPMPAGGGEIVVNAQFEAISYQVTRAATSTVPAANMTITPAGPQTVGTPMIVTVTPPTGQRIVAGSLAVTGVAGIELTATGATFPMPTGGGEIVVNAQFEAVTFRVTRAAVSTVPATNMAITPAGLQTAGTPMTVTVTPPAGQRIVTGSLTVTGVAGIELTATGATFPMPTGGGEIVVNAQFEAITYQVTRAATSTVPATNMAITPTGPQTVGTPMTVTVTPPAGQRIVAGSLAVTGVAGIELTATGATFPMPTGGGEIVVNAQFEVIPPPLPPNIILPPDTEYVIEEEEDGNLIITIPGEDEDIVITLTPDGEIEVELPGGGTVTVPPDSEVEVDVDDSITITVPGEEDGTVITVPGDGGGIEITPPGGGTVTVPPDSEIAVDDDGDIAIKVPEDGGTITVPGPDDDEIKVYLPGGGEVVIEPDGDITITVPDAGGTITMPDGEEIEIPGGGNAVIGPDGEVTIVAPPGTERGGLREALADAGERNEDDYSATSWAAFVAARDAAQTVFDNPASTQAEIDAAEEALRTAIAGLGKFHPAYMFGSPAGEFQPRANITRAQVAAILARTMIDDFEPETLPGDMSGFTAFSDVNPNNWFFHYVAWAYDAGLIAGDGRGRFLPNDLITRQELAAMLARTIKYAATAGRMPFTDVGDISGWADNYVYTAFREGWMVGDTQNRFRPRANITRAEVATAVNRILGRIDSRDALADLRTAGTIENEGRGRPFPDVAGTAWYFPSVLGAANDHYATRDEAGDVTWMYIRIQP